MENTRSVLTPKRIEAWKLAKFKKNISYPSIANKVNRSRGTVINAFSGTATSDLAKAIDKVLNVRPSDYAE